MNKRIFAGFVLICQQYRRPLDRHNQTLTPNPDAISFMAFFNTKEMGPVVIDMPPRGANGSLHEHHRHCPADGPWGCGLLGLGKDPPPDVERIAAGRSG